MMMSIEQTLTSVVLLCLILNTVVASDVKDDSTKVNGIEDCGRSNANSTRNSSNIRIIQAQEAEKGAWPWVVGIYLARRFNKIKRPSCGGVLISSSYVVTAGHCITRRGEPISTSDVSVRIGDHDLKNDKDDINATTVNVSAIKLHEEYDPMTFQNDIAVLRLEHPIIFSKHVQPICLPDESLNEEDLASKNAYVAGWGIARQDGDQSDVLTEMTAVITDDETCIDAYEGKTTITEMNICTVGRNGSSPCVGFGGSPLMLPAKDNKFYFIGITSFGVGCGNPEYPDVFTRVSKYLDWIKQRTSQER